MDPAPLTPQETACYQVLHRIVLNHLAQGIGWETLLTIAVRLLGQCVLQGIATRSLRTGDLEFLDAVGQTFQSWVGQPATQAFDLAATLAQEEAPYEEQAAYTLWAGLGGVLDEYRAAQNLTVWNVQRVAMRLLCDVSIGMSQALDHEVDERQHFQQVLQDGWRTHVQSHLRRRRKT